ncbi:MAG: isoleucine--tRNA ligase [Clostridia bacterium]|nr:isoleucine--tRNA ligase [Clostridia bacterium]
MFREVDNNLNFVNNELEVMKFWEENKIFEKSVQQNAMNTPFVFFDGPPTANGRPHIGHVLTRTIKDIIPRYKTMKGFLVKRKAGWDTHGLPVELEVEKELGFSNKDDILRFGIEPFIELCKKSVWKYKSEWEYMSRRVGYWCDFDHPYITYTDDYIESVWWALKELDKKGLLYSGYKIVPFCPRCSTSLSSHEVDQGYKTVKDTSVYVKFKVKGEDKYFLAWTTTPWTLLSNVALCVNPNNTYCTIKTETETLILAKELVAKLFEDGQYEIVEEYPGKALEFVEYEQMFPTAPLKQKAFYVVCDDYVTLDSGTGVVHIAPAFGEDDARVGTNYGLPFLQLVNDKGEFTEDSLFPGVNFKVGNNLVIEELKKQNFLFKAEMFEHNYPHCWRCDTPLIYYATKSWFVKMSALRQNLMDNNETVNWFPDNCKHGRMGTFLENAKDWCLTRNRYWGTPLPVWKCECEHYITVGSKAELEALVGKPVKELHKPFLDDLTIPCPHCGKPMRREPEVIDCWFDSGSMPFAQLHYPFENKDIFDKNYPADFISEGLDQTRGWFYSLQAISTALFNRSPYKNVIALGLVNDKNGVKMSKHLGNVVTPNEVLDTSGADAVRWCFASTSAPWLSTRFSKDLVEESKRKFLGTLWNTYSFFVLYANIDGYNPKDYDLEASQFSMMDKWLLAELNTLIQKVDDMLAAYDIYGASNELIRFVDNLSNWYIRRCRKRFWAEGMEADKVAAYNTLYHTLTTLVKLIAPFTPFIAENLYQNLVANIDVCAPESVHLADFPTPNPKFDNKKLQDEMNLVRDVVVLGRNARATANIGNRQPLSKISLHITKAATFTDEMLKNIKEELNIDTVEILDSATDLMVYQIKPQLKTLGPKYGKALGAIREYLAAANGANLLADIQQNGVHKFMAGDVEVELSKDDILVSSSCKNGGAAATADGITVILDTTLTPQLVERGLIFDLISKIQNIRKDMDFKVEQRIDIHIQADKELEDVISNQMNMLTNGLIVNNIFLVENIENGTEIKVGKYNAKLLLRA